MGRGCENSMISLPRTLQFTLAINEQFELVTVAKPVIDKLRNVTSETTHLNIQEGFERVCVYCIQGTGEVRAYMRLGQRSPLHLGASAKVLLAFRSDLYVEHYIKDYLLPDPAFNQMAPAVLRESIKQIRELGYCITDRERTRDAIGVSAPIRNVTGEIVGAIAITCPSTRCSSEVEFYKNEVIKAAQEISILLGFLPK